MSNYLDKLKDPRWQKKRLEMLDFRGWACEICCEKEKTLHVHHSAYFDHLEPWEYHTRYLRVLCEECHEKEHFNIKEEIEQTIDLFSLDYGFTKIEILWLLEKGYEVLTK